jgi:hypothetical protein
MSVSWSLNIAGSSAGTLTALGVTRCSIVRRNMAISELRFTIKVSSAYSAPIAAYGDTVKLYRDAVCWFVGTVSSLPVSGDAETEEQHYVVSDAWYKLERIIYQQPYVYRSTDFTKFLGGYSSHVTLGRDAWGSALTPTEVIEAIATFAGVTTVSVLSTPTNIPLIEARDISCAEAIRRQVSLTPDCIGWFDYSSGTAVLQLKRRTDITATDLDLSDADLIERVGDLTPRNDLLVNGVVLVFLTTAVDTDNNTWLQETRQTAGTTTGEGVIFATINLSAQGTEEPEAVPSGVAAAYYATLTALQYEGTLRLHQEECAGTALVGSTINLLSGRAAWATMEAVVQSSTEDLMRGTTEIDLGPPIHLGAEDFVGLMGSFRKLPPATTFPSNQNNGTAGVPIADGGLGPDPVLPPVVNADAGFPSMVGMFPSVDVQYCDAGTTRTLRAVGFPI